MLSYALYKGICSSGRLVAQTRSFQSSMQTSTICKSYLYNNLPSACSVRSYGSSLLMSTVRSRFYIIKCYSNAFLRRKSLLGCLRIRQFGSDPNNVNTKVANNVMLFKFERPSFFTLLHISGGILLVSFLVIAEMVYRLGCKTVFNSELSLKQRLNDNAYGITVSLLLLILGPLIYTIIWVFTLRSVKYIVLNKGGSAITLVTYFPFKGEKVRKLPLKMISCKMSRDYAKSYVTVKAKDTRFNYLMDTNGQFINPELFDSTVGLNRF